jgi:hypothetical protein
MLTLGLLPWSVVSHMPSVFAGVILVGKSTNLAKVINSLFKCSTLKKLFTKFSYHGYD